MYPRNGPLGQEEAYTPLYEEPEPSWWERIWTPVEKVLKTGTEVFTQVAPYTIEPKGVTPTYFPGVPKLPTTQQPWYAPWFPGVPTRPEDRAYPTGYDPSSPYIVLASGQVVRRPPPAQPTNMAMPLVIGFGAILLFTTMGKKRRR